MGFAPSGMFLLFGMSFVWSEGLPVAFPDAGLAMMIHSLNFCPSRNVLSPSNLKGLFAEGSAPARGFLCNAGERPAHSLLLSEESAVK